MPGVIRRSKDLSYCVEFYEAQLTRSVPIDSLCGLSRAWVIITEALSLTVPVPAACDQRRFVIRTYSKALGGINEVN